MTASTDRAMQLGRASAIPARVRETPRAGPPPHSGAGASGGYRSQVTGGGVAGAPAEVAEQCGQRHVADVPAKRDPLDAHHGNPRRRADDENAAAGAGAVGEKQPEVMI